MEQTYKAFLQMIKERDSFVEKKKAAKIEMAKYEEQKEMLGGKVVEMALLRNT